MGRISREVGLAAAFGALAPKAVRGVELWIALVLGGLIGCVGQLLGSTAGRVALVGAFFQATVALLGIVFAGVAIMASMLSDAYLRLLEQGKHGVRAFLQPFLFAMGFQMITTLFCAIYLAYSPVSPSLALVESIHFLFVGPLFVYSVLGILPLTRSVFMHVMLRAQQLSKGSQE